MLDRMIRAFRHKNYKLYFFGQGVSLVGNWLTTVAMSWTVYRLTRESQPERAVLLLGVVGFSGQIPMLIFAPIAGVFVDRWNRWSILVATTALSMLLTAALATLSLTGAISIAQLIGFRAKAT